MSYLFLLSGHHRLQSVSAIYLADLSIYYLSFPYTLALSTGTSLNFSGYNLLHLRYLDRSLLPQTGSQP